MPVAVAIVIASRSIVVQGVVSSAFPWIIWRRFYRLLKGTSSAHARRRRSPGLLNWLYQEYIFCEVNGSFDRVTVIVTVSGGLHRSHIGSEAA